MKMTRMPSCAKESFPFSLLLSNTTRSGHSLSSSKTQSSPTDTGPYSDRVAAALSGTYYMYYMFTINNRHHLGGIERGHAFQTKFSGKVFIG